jgi:hypothetical protein
MCIARSVGTRYRRQVYEAIRQQRGRRLVPGIEAYLNYCDSSKRYRDIKDGQLIRYTGFVHFPDFRIASVFIFNTYAFR